MPLTSCSGSWSHDGSHETLAARSFKPRRFSFLFFFKEALCYLKISQGASNLPPSGIYESPRRKEAKLGPSNVRKKKA
jgi:hypothetical protein